MRRPDRRRARLSLLQLAAASLALAGCGSASVRDDLPVTTIATHYSIEEVTGPGDGCENIAINDNGLVLGQCCTDTDQTIYLRTHEGGRVDQSPPGAKAFALNLNNAGVYVALENTATCLGYGLQDSQSASNLTGVYAPIAPPSGQAEFVASDINDSNGIIGYTATKVYGVWVYQEGKYDFIANNFVGQSLNDAGVIAGYQRHNVAVFDGGSLTTTPVSGPVNVSDINESGVIVGTLALSNGGAWHPFVDKDGEVVDIGTLGADVPSVQQPSAYRVNDGDIVVGWAPTTSGRGGAFAWTEKQRMVDLTAVVNDPDWDLWSAMGINNKGEIVGQGRHNGVLVGYVMTPN